MLPLTASFTQHSPPQHHTGNRAGPFNPAAAFTPVAPWGAWGVPWGCAVAASVCPILLQPKRLREMCSVRPPCPGSRAAGRAQRGAGILLSPGHRHRSLSVPPRLHQAVTGAEQGVLGDRTPSHPGQEPMNLPNCCSVHGLQQVPLQSLSSTREGRLCWGDRTKPLSPQPQELLYCWGEAGPAPPRTTGPVTAPVSLAPLPL